MRGCRPFTDQEVKTIINGFKQSEYKYKSRDLAIFMYGIHTGFRISELLSMRIQDVSHQWKAHGFARVRRGFTKTKNAGDSKKVEPQAIHYMQDWLDELKEQKTYKKSDYVFQSQWTGNRSINRNYFYTVLIEICTQNGIYGNVGTHSMRKTFTNKLRAFLLQEARDTDTPFDVDEILQVEGRWTGRESMEKYLTFIGTDIKNKPIFDYED